MKSTFYLFLTFCLTINASQKPQKSLLFSAVESIRNIEDSVHDVYDGVQLLRSKSKELKHISNAACLGLTCCACYYCPQTCCCGTSCILLTKAGCVAYEKFISTEPKKQ